MAFDSVQTLTNTYTHLLEQYPNNRFVARGYTQFLQEILGDYEGFVDWLEKTRLLQRGIAVSPDIANRVGLEQFPELPHATSPTGRTAAAVLQDQDESNFGGDDTVDEDLHAVERVAVIRKAIERLTIPAITSGVVLPIVMTALFIIAPSVVLISIIPVVQESMSESLGFMFAISRLRSFGFSIPLWAHHWLGENITFPGDTAPLFTVVDARHERAFLGPHPDSTKGQLEYFIRECAKALESLGPYRGFYRRSPVLEPVHRYLFTESIPYSYYSDIHHSEPSTASVFSFLVDACLQISELLTQTPSISGFNTSNLVNPLINSHDLASTINEVLTVLTTYLLTEVDDTGRIINYVRYASVPFMVVLWVALSIWQFFRLRSNRAEVYKCLTALPKSCVSALGESLRVMKKEEVGGGHGDISAVASDVEVSKQEENLLKLFASAGDGSSGGVPSILYQVAQAVLVAFAAICVVLGLNMIPLVLDILERNAPHVDDIIGTSGYMFGTQLTLYNMAIGCANGYAGLVPTCYGMGNVSYMDGVVRAEERLEVFLDFYHRGRYGKPGTNTEPPLAGYGDQTTEATAILFCADPYAVSKDVRSIFGCLTVDIQILLFEVLVNRALAPFKFNLSNAEIDARDPLFEQLWILALNMYDTVFAPLFIDLLEVIEEEMNQAVPSARAPIIVIMCFALIIVIALVADVLSVGRELKFVLRLLLQVDPVIVSQTGKIMDVLAGDFRDRTKDSTSRNELFFEKVMKSLPDAVVVANAQYKIISSNAAFERIFHKNDQVEPESDLRQLFRTAEFRGDVSPLFGQPAKEATLEYRTDSTAYIKVQPASVAQHYVFTIRDVTQQVLYHALIKEERAKSDAMLASILPANLVPRVQAGEANISFAVQTASVSFMDIVEFTPWCAANTASTVMTSLNALYREMDALCLSKPTMTKIKCIGDCYMAAGGIFAELNQPAVHAKEMVEFGLGSIAAVLRVNGEIGQNLRIRVGINSGGPLVAGVLGTEKPTFEILGPVINMAQQMEHEGVPMNVHISRATYELIYGGNFIIKERGQIEIKQGKVVTYLVEGQRND